jgi:hypothetical protein
MRTDTWTIEGGVPLRGEVRVSGAKNSITKLMVASMLTTEPCVLHNVPHIGDSQITRAICEALGTECKELPPRTLQVQTSRLVSEVPLALGTQNRLAIMMVAPLLHRRIGSLKALFTTVPADCTPRSTPPRLGNSNAMLPMTSVASAGAYLLSAPVELEPNARHEPCASAHRLHAFVRPGDGTKKRLTPAGWPFASAPTSALPSPRWHPG